MNESRQISRRIGDTGPGPLRVRSGDGTGYPLMTPRVTSRASWTLEATQRPPARPVHAPDRHLPAA